MERQLQAELSSEFTLAKNGFMIWEKVEIKWVNRK